MEKLAQLYKMDITDLLRFSDQNMIHSINNSDGNHGFFNENITVHNSCLGEEEKALYKETIRRLEEQNNKLMKLIEKLSEK